MKKTLALLLALAMTAALFVGCTATPVAPDATKPASEGGKPAPAAEATTEGATIRILTHYKDAIDAIKAPFEEAAGIKVEIDNCNWEDLTDTYEVILSSGSGEYDAILADGPNVAAYVNRGYLAPLTDYFTADEIAAFSPALAAQGTVDGTFYAAPLGDSSTLLYYNKNLLSQAGITWDWDQYDGKSRITWEELVDLAKQVQAKVDPNGAKAITGIEFGQVSLIYMMNLLPNALGGANISEDGLSVDGILNSEAWLTALKWYQGLVQEGVFSRGIAVGETYNNFYVDKAAFIIMTADSIPYIQSAGMADDAYGFTYMPAFAGHEDQAAAGCGNWAAAINANSTNKAATAEFIKWLSYGEGNEPFMATSGMAPNMESRFTDAAIEINPCLAYAKYQCAQNAVVRAVTPGFNEYSAALNTMWEDIRNGADVDATVAATIETVDAALAAYKK